MIDVLEICLAIALCFAVIAYGAIFINYEVSKEKEEAKQMITNLQAEVDNLKVSCNNKRTVNLAKTDESIIKN